MSASDSSTRGAGRSAGGFSGSATTASGRCFTQNLHQMGTAVCCTVAHILGMVKGQASQPTLRGLLRAPWSGITSQHAELASVKYTTEIPLQHP